MKQLSPLLEQTWCHSWPTDQDESDQCNKKISTLAEGFERATQTRAIRFGILSLPPLMQQSNEHCETTIASFGANLVSFMAY